MYTLKELFGKDVQVVCTPEDQVIRTPEDLVNFGRSKHWYFQIMEEKGELIETICKSEWMYENLTDYTTLPDFAKKRLDAVLAAGFPVEQKIIGHEIKQSQVAPQIKEIQMPEVDWGKVGTILATITLGAVAVVGYSMMLALTAVDPKLIVRLSGDPRWICLISWADN